MKISFVRDALVQPGQGRLALCRGPGTGDVPTTADLDALVAAGVAHVVCLQQPRELQRLEPPESIADRRGLVEARQMSFTHEPIEDFSTPQLAQAQVLVDRVAAQLARGETVALHCWAGLGRAGTIAACVLVRQGMKPHDAIAAVRDARPGAIQTPQQEAFVRAFAG
jgi:ADP-ribosyl-[dinitrogen reductase] hydrolase